MRIGIFTFHFAHNYGAVLQVYALQKTLEKIGHNVEVVDYRPESIELQYKNRLVIPFGSSVILKTKLILSYLINFKSKKRKGEKFEGFSRSFLNLSDKKYKKNEVLPYEVYVFGSDQIWNPNITGGFDSAYFGSFPTVNKDLRTISYAASFGVSDLTNNQTDELKELINGLDYISIREKRGKELIKNLTKKKVQVVLDPTFLLSMREWEKIAITPSGINRYLLIYKLEENNEMIKSAKKIADKYGLKIIEISNSKGRRISKKNHKIITDSGPQEMLGLFKKADYVVTNSFHGTAFAIIFKKNFYTYAHSKVPSRMENILLSLNLKDRLLDFNEELIEIKDVDYNTVENNIEKHKEASLEFLKNALLSK